MWTKSIPYGYLLLTASVILSSLSAYGGNESPHGGDGIICRHVSFNEFDGFYALDFVAYHHASAMTYGPVPDALEQAATDDVALNWIQTHLNAKVPAIASDFAEFRKLIFSNNERASQRWVPTGDLEFIPDQGLFLGGILHLPLNCSRLNIAQLVVRQVINGTTFFYYDAERVSKLNPLQKSFLLIHEWLREYSQNPRWIRGVNHLFHSSLMVEMTPRELREEILKADD